jgi:hypothetical protein
MLDAYRRSFRNFTLNNSEEIGIQVFIEDILNGSGRRRCQL